ncbi:CPBP family intramembrane glutamic endopeptidase [Streptomyces sp. NBC_00568]|uniref:CPBP family intramembrane glutamic endopeptidase n=1 Tax=Streptomyces sp. NBC_00568 TaxID=2975779 RepID=UPI00224D92B2|nr:type II CAAX endopeptidase family protein [Streptomyces sp. NBC_00568]
MTTAPLLTALPYHRMAHYTGRHRWWRPLLGTSLLIAGWMLLVLFLDTLAYGVGKAAGYTELPDGTIDFGPVRGTVLDLAYLAVALPLILVVIRSTGGRPAGTVSSVIGRLRWLWLTRCALVAVPAVALLALAVVFLPGMEGGPQDAPDVWVGWQHFLPAMAVLMLFVPLQAAAEEYAFRGWLMQAVGGFFRSPWIAVLPQAAAFAAAHGWGTQWGFADLLVFGAVAGWLTIRTGGLEAAIALHALNNLLAFGLSAAVVDGLSSDDTAADAPWQLAAVDTALVLVYASIVLWLARRYRPMSISPSATLHVESQMLVPVLAQAPAADVFAAQPLAGSTESTRTSS